MFRFLFNFVLFGFLFYLISVYFPDTFHTLITWAQDTYQWVKDLIAGQMQPHPPVTPPPPVPPAP